jgi:hypothetical protein
MLTKKYLYPIVFVFVFVLIVNHTLQAQNSRLSDNSTIGWFSVNSTFKISSKIGFTTEFHWRRVELVNKPMAGLWRSSLNYQIHPKVQFRIGYALIENFPYGVYPLNGFGKEFTEHRMFQALLLTDKISRLELSHRFMLEQRWIGRYSNGALEKEDSYVYGHRWRYMLRMQIPLFKQSMDDNTVFLAASNEAMIGFGKNVNENIFDQNRLAFLLGYRFDSRIRMEAGYLNHIFQLAREIDGRNVFQHNNGLVFNLLLSFDWSKKQ